MLQNIPRTDSLRQDDRHCTACNLYQSYVYKSSSMINRTNYYSRLFLRAYKNNQSQPYLVRSMIELAQDYMRRGITLPTSINKKLIGRNYATCICFVKFEMNPRRMLGEMVNTYSGETVCEKEAQLVKI